ncbi:major facilitator superfamily domain-containing protein [Amylocarpus encephaloides]|uniref:Major facilitator superfamily domain-containing protein n=1 Tax=Amylocarpus encephaloides TaxID=45428 RepID=A0A9P8CAH2_9HELO|nr:major facilitator superfamily domain-containing protein [Amylocarpus encephaloides]
MEDEYVKDDDTEIDDANDNGHPFPAKQLFFLALCRIAEPIALTLVFPFSNDMIKSFGGEVAEKSGLYNGLFLGSFSMAEMITAFLWGMLSDKIGRKPVLLLGCIGTAISMLVIGFSKNIWMAILGRAFGGGLNGNIGVVQTMVGELVTNPKHEPRAYTIMPIFYSIGITIGPAIGGYLAKPAESFPSSLGKVRLFVKFPYLLPNLVCVTMLLVTVCLVVTLLKETHPKILERRRRKASQEHGLTDPGNTPLLSGLDGTADEAAYGTDSSSSSIFGDPKPSLKVSWKILNPIIAICLLTSHTLSYIQLIPIFLQAKHDYSVPKYFLGGVGGLERPLWQSGRVMMTGGFVSMFVQAVLFTMCTNRFGIIRVFAFVTFLHPVVYFTLPYIAFIPDGVWQNVVFYTWLIIRTIFGVFPYPIFLIFVKRATPDSAMLGRVNGIVASTGAAFRTVSPPLAGLLQTIGDSHHLSALPWWGTGMLAVVGSIQCWSLVKQFR